MAVDTDLKLKVCAFIVDAWLKSKGAKMEIVRMQAEQAIGSKIYLRDIFNLSFMRESYDVFSFVAQYFPKTSTYLLETKKGEKERIDKIVKFMANSVAYENKANKRYLGNAASNCNSTERTSNARGSAYSIEVEKTRRNKHNWKVVS